MTTNSVTRNLTSIVSALFLFTTIAILPLMLEAQESGSETLGVAPTPTVPLPPLFPLPPGPPDQLITDLTNATVAKNAETAEVNCVEQIEWTGLRDRILSKFGDLSRAEQTEAAVRVGNITKKIDAAKDNLTNASTQLEAAMTLIMARDYDNADFAIAAANGDVEAATVLREEAHRIVVQTNADLNLWLED